MKKCIYYAMLLVSTIALIGSCSKKEDYGQLTGFEWLQGDWTGGVYSDEGARYATQYLRIMPEYYQYSYNEPITDETERVAYTLKKGTLDGGDVEVYWLDEEAGWFFFEGKREIEEWASPDNTLTKNDLTGEEARESSSSGRSLGDIIEVIVRWLVWGLILLLILWAVLRIRKWYLKSKDKIAVKAQEAKEKAIELGEKAKEKVVEVAADAKDKIADASEKAKEKSPAAGWLRNLWRKTWFKIAVIAAALILLFNFVLEFFPDGDEYQNTSRDEREMIINERDEEDEDSYDYYRKELGKLQTEMYQAASRSDWNTYHFCEREIQQLKAEARIKYPNDPFFF